MWLAGTRISLYASTIAEKTGIGTAIVGIVLLGGITSLPEVAVTVSASLAGNADLAINNVLGGVAMQVAIIAIGDAVLGKEALSSITARPVVLLQANLGVLLLCLVAAGVVVGEISLGFVGVWSTAILLGYIVSVWLIHVYQRRPTWIAAEKAGEPGHAGGGGAAEDHGARGGADRSAAAEGEHDAREDLSPAERLARAQHRRAEAARERSRAAAEEAAAAEERARGLSPADPDEEAREGDGRDSLRRTYVRTAVAALVILAAGYVLSRTGDAIAVQTGLGQSFVGAVLVAISTSLPEISTVISAVRLHEYELAFSDVFGTNLVDVALIFVVDAIHSGPPVLDLVGNFSLVAALLGIVVTTLYATGLVERRDRTIFGLGYDSAAVVTVYLGGLYLLYTLR